MRDSPKTTPKGAGTPTWHPGGILSQLPSNHALSAENWTVDQDNLALKTRPLRRQPPMLPRLSFHRGPISK